jgi:hypothetical protein
MVVRCGGETAATIAAQCKALTPSDTTTYGMKYTSVHDPVPPPLLIPLPSF